MSAISVLCPNCQRKLKIPDASMLGKKGKCPGCQTPFVLTLPAQGGAPAAGSEKTVASPSRKQAAARQARPSIPVGQQTRKGTPAKGASKPRQTADRSAPVEEKKSVPGVAAQKAATAKPNAAAASPLPHKSGPEVTAKSSPVASPSDDVDSSNFEFLSEPPPESSRDRPPAADLLDFSFVESSAPAGATRSPPVAAPAPAVAKQEFAFAAATESSPSGLKELERLRARRKSIGWRNWAVFGGIAAAAVGVVTFFAIRGASVGPAPAPLAAAPAVPAPVIERPAEGAPYSRAQLQRDAKLVQEFAPTSGQPISLLMMPSGVNVVVHLRPALLWSEDFDARVLRSSLTDEVTNWLAATLKSVCRREPQEIDETVIGVILGALGDAPKVCAVVRLKEPAKMSDLLEEFRGPFLYDLSEKPGLRLKVDDVHGYLLHDEQTIAICPKELAPELEHWIATPNYEVSEGISQMLSHSDRERLFTVIGDPADIARHLPELLPAGARGPVAQALDWLGEDVETAMWSVHPQPYFHSQLLLRPTGESDPGKLQARISAQLEALPERLWKEVCLKMTPREMRFRTLIGRLPAMVEALRLATVDSRESRLIRLTSVLPSNAAPNLALATLFTVDEASRTDFDRAPPAAKPAAATATLPATLRERLQLPVDAEFNRTPLEQALQYLCDEVQVKLTVDGDALKDAGYTKNMPQTFNLGKTPMQRALFEIVNSYQEPGKEMVVSLDEATMTVHVLTRKFAEARGLPVAPGP